MPPANARRSQSSVSDAPGRRASCSRTGPRRGDHSRSGSSWTTTSTCDGSPSARADERGDDPHPEDARRRGARGAASMRWVSGSPAAAARSAPTTSGRSSACTKSVNGRGSARMSPRSRNAVSSGLAASTRPSRVRTATPTGRGRRRVSREVGRRPGRRRSGSAEQACRRRARRASSSRAACSRRAPSATGRVPRTAGARSRRSWRPTASTSAARPRSRRVVGSAGQPPGSTSRPPTPARPAAEGLGAQHAGEPAQDRRQPVLHRRGGRRRCRPRAHRSASRLERAPDRPRRAGARPRGCRHTAAGSGGRHGRAVRSRRHLLVAARPRRALGSRQCPPRGRDRATTTGVTHSSVRSALQFRIRSAAGAAGLHPYEFPEADSRPVRCASSQLSRPVASASQVRGSASTTFGGVPRPWREAADALHGPERRHPDLDAAPRRRGGERGEALLHRGALHGPLRRRPAVEPGEHRGRRRPHVPDRVARHGSAPPPHTPASAGSRGAGAEVARQGGARRTLSRTAPAACPPTPSAARRAAAAGSRRRRARCRPSTRSARRAPRLRRRAPAAPPSPGTVTSTRAADSENSATNGSSAGQRVDHRARDRRSGRTRPAPAPARRRRGRARW